MYNNLERAMPSVNNINQPKVDAIDTITKQLIDSFPPYEAAEVLNGVKQNLQAYYKNKIEDAKANVDRMIKESDPIYNL